LNPQIDQGIQRYTFLLLNAVARRYSSVREGNHIFISWVSYYLNFNGSPITFVFGCVVRIPKFPHFFKGAVIAGKVF
jgi:hypothetical protein